MKTYTNFLKFNSKWLSAKLWISQHKLKYSIIFTTTRIILIIENTMICFSYVFVSFCERINYWIDYIGYWISRASYRKLKEKI